MIGHEAFKAAGIAQLYGVDAMEMLESTDPVEVLALQALVHTTAEAGRRLDEARANLHANAIGQVLAKMFKK